MKNQPLTRKKLIAIIRTDLWDEGGKYPRGYYKRNVKSATEWFIQEMKRLNKETSANIHIASVIGVIKEAFPDLYHPKRRRA